MTSDIRATHLEAALVEPITLTATQTATGTPNIDRAIEQAVEKVMRKVATDCTTLVDSTPHIEVTVTASLLGYVQPPDFHGMTDEWVAAVKLHGPRRGPIPYVRQVTE